MWTNEGESEPDNHGNFIELVCFRAESDEVLRHHLQSAPRNAMYTSKTIQNELINIIGSMIQSDILREIKQAKFYTVIADEVSDVSNKEQLSFSICYVLNGIVHESFIDFAEVERITDQALASSILHCVKAWALSLSNMRGQCYDGASNMSGAVAGCRSLVQQEEPMAIYFHCASHRLNLAIVSASSVQAFNNTEAYIGEMAQFFSYSAKRRLLDKAMDSLSSTERKETEGCLSDKGIDSYTVFLELLPAVHVTLQAMSYPHLYVSLGTDWKWDTDTVTTANSFLYQLESFLVCFKILLQVLANLRGLTVKLQQCVLDVLSAYKEVESVISVMKLMRDNSESEFARIFEDNQARSGTSWQ